MAGDDQPALNDSRSAPDLPWVELEFSETKLSVQIWDDGKGFVVPWNPAEFPKKGHFGLLSLQERLELINAK